MDPNDYPFRVPDEDRLNVLIVGPPLSGKTSAARALAAKDGRRVLSVNDVVEWALSGPPSLQSEEDVARRDRFLDAIAKGDEEHDRLEAEREVACKKLKQQFVRRPVEHYAFPVEDVVHLIQRRTALPDCNCGTIFDGLDTKYLASKEKAAEAILMANHEEKFSVLYISLHQQLGLDGHDPLKLGHVASPLRDLEQGSPETDEAFQQLASLLKPYYAGLQESFQLECTELQAKLQEVEAEDAALGDMPEPVPAQSESGSPTMDEAAELSPELLELQSRKKTIEQQLQELQNQLAASQAALTRLETACLGGEAEHAAETRRVLSAIERAASSADERRRSTLILAGEGRDSSAEATAEETAAESLARFEPPERQEEAAPQPDNIEEVATPPPDVATLESLISFVPLALDGDTSAGFFERLKAATQAVIPMPLVPEARPLPPPSFVQLVGRPQQRPPRAPPEHFSIVTEESPDPNKAPSPPPQSTTPAPRGSKIGSAHHPIEPPVEEPKDTQPKTRWLIEPHSSCELLLKFFSNEIGTFTGNLGFEVVGGINGNAPTSLNATGVTAFPAISSDPRNVFMRRVKTKPASGYAHKQFILSQGVFDFGPLLVGRDPNSRRLPEAEEGQPPPQLDTHVRQHVEALRITNNSLFRAKVSFDWASLHAQEEHAAAVPEKPAKGKAKAKEEKGVDHHFEHYPFLVEPKVLELEIDETKELQVSCFPVKEGTYSDTLVATVQHNPEPVHFPVAAIGALPKVNLDASEVDFDRLLLKQVATNCVKLANVCAVPVRWQLQPVGKEGVPEPFVIEPMEGTLSVSEEKNIEVTFKAVEPAAHEFSLRLQITDTEGLRPMQDAQDVEIRAEAFLVDVLPEFPNAGRGLDFGDVRVGATAEQQFTVANNGKYAVNYELRVRRKAIREILEIEAVRGDDGVAVLQPGQKRIVKVRLSPKSEFQCPEPHRNRKNEELDLQIFEAQTGEQVHLEIPPISLSFRALFNSFSVSPPRGLTFGSVKMGESGVRDFEITNDGIFKFDWSLFEPTRPVSDGGPMARKVDKGELTIGPFKIKPAEGVLNPKESARIEVRFTALQDAHYDCKMGIHVEGMPEASEPEHRNTATGRLGSVDMMEQTHMTAFLPGNTGVVAAKETGFREYLLTAQGCTPGIETESLQTVFEEQFMARSLEDAIAMAGRIDIRAYVEEDRVFSFGPVVVQGPSESSGSDAAKFRITNPRAIPCDVKFSIKPRVASKDPKDPPAFDLSTDGLHIPPHEYRYVKVRFRPPGLQTYVASFEAAVPEGKDPRTNLLQFELRGDGTVPTVSLDGPPLFGDGGGEFKFGKLQVGRSHSIDFILRNDGIVPAVARCDCSASPHFHVTCTRSVTLEPKAQYPFKVSFQPTASGELSMTLHLHTLHNPFEDATIKFVGEGYVDEVSWDLQDVPGGAEGAEATAQTAVTPPSPDELNLGEVALGAEAAVTFYVSNTSRHPIRFQFPEVPPAPFASCLQISPSVGHVLPGARKPITFTLRPTERFSEEVSLPASIASIEYEGEAEDWDDSMKTVNFEQKTTSPRAAQSSATPRGGQSSSPPRGVHSGSAYQSYAEEVMEEPAHRIRDGTTRNLPLRVLAAADERTYECTAEKIRFSPTVLFQTRVHRFRISNPGAVTLPFEWAFRPLDADARAPAVRAYSIQPAKGVVAASSEQEFTVRFSPVEVEAFECQLECQIPHLASRLQPLQIPVDGSALRPWCHFELPPSDYRTRRQSDVPLDPKYQIVEFESLGTRVKNTKRFYVLNPTAESYEFVWKQEENDKKGEQEDPFRCLTKHGTISPGKKFEMVFDYLPMTMTTQESFWTFSILGKDATQWFVLVGSVQEPRVGLDCPSINFGRLLLGARGRETLRVVNREHLPFSCSFQRASFEAEGQVPTLSLSPMTAVVGPGASLPVEVTFEPAEEKCYNFNVVCTSKRREKPIMLNVKGEGYKIHTKLILEEPGQEDRQLHPGVKEALDFGSLQVQERRGFTLRLSSPTFTRRQSEGMDTTSEEMPNVRYDFIWQVRTSSGSIAQPRPDAPPYLTISPMHGVATQDEETVIRIEYAPPESHSLDGTSLRMLIPSGPGDSSYNLKLAGHARRPLLDFSTTSHDFGACFVKRGGVAGSLEPQAGFPNNTPFERLDLVVTNRDQMDCWLTTTFQRTSWIDVQLVSSMIEAGGSLTVPIIFTPRDYVEYREQIDFVINDTTMTTVSTRGSGCQLQLEMASMAMQNVDFGVTVGNQPVSRTVKVVNRSKRSLEFFFEDAEGQLSEHCVSWSPPRPVTLRPKELATFEVYFAPSFHVAPFKLPIVANCGFGQEVHLFNVSGTCHTAELRLSEHSIIFGDVVFQSTAVRQLRLHNFGDLGVKFRFELPGRAASLFSVEPSEGYAPLHDDVQLQVRFHPTRPGGGPGDRSDPSARPRKLRCHFDPAYQQPLELIVQGQGVEQPEAAVQLIEFTTEVRERKTREILFPPEPLGKNPTGEPWRLTPVVATEVPGGVDYWSCPAELVIPPGGQAALEIAYKPLTMTLREEDKAAATEAEDVLMQSRKSQRRRELPPEKHVGKVFIPTPDGSAFVFNLEGTALPPKDAKRISAEVQCKTPHIQAVAVSNWLRETQRFSVKLSLVQPPDAGEEIKLHGVEAFDLQPGVTKEYKFNVYAYREGTALARLVLTNQKTEEFLTYEVAFKFVAPDTIGTINLSAACRQMAAHPLSLVNPLSTPASFKCESSHPDVRFKPPTLTVAPGSEGLVEVVFRPVLAGAGQATLRLVSPELGEYPYTLKYDARPAGLEKTIVLKAPLGSTDTVQNFTFMHYARKPAVYTWRLEAAPGHNRPSSDFLMEPKEVKVNAATEDGLEVTVDVRFQPSCLGEVRSVLVLSSPDGGEYKALLVGYAQQPQPQGPIVIQNGKAGAVEFYNPFDEAVEFTVQVDNPVFVVGSRTFRLDSKKSSSITVQFKSDKSQGGRLIVTATHKVPTPWIFFLKGAV